MTLTTKQNEWVGWVGMTVCAMAVVSASTSFGEPWLSTLFMASMVLWLRSAMIFQRTGNKHDQLIDNTRRQGDQVVALLKRVEAKHRQDEATPELSEKLGQVTKAEH